VAHFDSFAPAYQQTVDASIGFIGKDWDFFANAKVECLLDLIAAQGLVAGQCSALDVGCGIGGMDGGVAAEVSSLVGVDISSRSIAEATRRHPDVTYRVYEGRRLPFPDGHFDVVFTACVMHHVPPGQWDDFVGELHRVARTGGLVVIFEHNRLNPLTRRAVAACPFDEGVVLLTPRWVTAACRRAGGRVVARNYTMFIPREGALVRRMERAIGWLPLGAQYVVASAPLDPALGSASELAEERVAG